MSGQTVRRSGHTGRWPRVVLLVGHGTSRGLVLLLTAPIRAYQLLISPLLGPCCRFYPSCSSYAVQALRAHGPVRGGGLAVWRVLRCHPWNLGGVDPVPARRPSMMSTRGAARRASQGAGL